MKKLQIKVSASVLGLALASVNVARAAFYPIPLTPGSYNADVVVEASAIPGPLVPDGYTTASMDGGTNNNGDTWHEAGFFTNESPVVSGLPAAGTIITSAFNANHLYQFAPSYIGNDAIMLDSVFFTNASYTLSAPTLLGALSFLTSGGNGGCIFRVIVSHADGTTETVTNNSPDWFFGANPAYTSNGRCNAQGFSSDNYNSANPRLYERDSVLSNTTSPVTNLFFQFISSAGGAHSGILAISGQAPGGSGNFNPLPGAGYNADIVVEASAGPPIALLTNYVSVSMDGGTNRTGATWYERGFDTINPNTGLPPAGSILVSTNLPDHQYQMPASYAANNCIYADSNSPIAAVAFVSPTNLTGLSFLSADANGAIQVQVQINHADATVETKLFTSKDWFNGTPAAFTAAGRVQLGSRVEDSVLPVSTNPRLYEAQFSTDPANLSPVTGVTLTWTTNGNPSASSRFVIFAISGTTNPVAPIFVSQPTSIKTNNGVVVNFFVTASGSAPLSYQWQKGTNGVYVNLSDIGNVSGSLTTNLVLNNVTNTDEADYRVVVSNTAGTGNSVAANLLVISDLPDVTQPGDPIVAYQPNGGSSPGAEAVLHAIDDDTSKYLNFGANGGSPFAGPVGFVVTPLFGRSRVSVMRIYTANDSPERDPAGVVLEGSDNGGASWTLITSNYVTMPDARNASPAAIDPIADNIVQIRFANTNAYTLYRWSVTATKNSATANSMQVGEVELLGVADTSGKPTFNPQPASVTVYQGNPASFTAGAAGTPTPGLYWQRGSNGVYQALTDGANISGTATGNLQINAANFSDVADYICIATNTSGSVTSVVAHLSVVSTNTDVTQPSDLIVAIGDQSLGFWGAAGTPANAIDNLNTVKYQNGGSGFSASAGFPPFVGPAGVAVTPGVGPTRLVGLRIYTADGNVERDPADYTLAGSNDGGTTYVTISTGALNLPLDRSNNLQPFDPTLQPMQEVLFPATSLPYTSYQLTFLHTRNDNTANSVQVGEIELLGRAIPTLTINPDGAGGLVISSSIPGELQSTTNILTAGSVWADEGPISGTVTITPNPATPTKLYRVLVP